MGLYINGHGNLGHNESKYDVLKTKINQIVLYKTTNSICEKILYGIKQNNDFSISALIGDVNIGNCLTDIEVEKSMFWVNIDFFITKHFDRCCTHS